MRLDADVDIDVSNREQLLELIDHVPASIRTSDPIRKHPSGIYITEIPNDPIYGMSSIDYTEAERRGYFKLDILNVYIYENVKDEDHLYRLMKDPDWSMLNQRKIVSKLIHINNYFGVLQRLPEPVNSIPRLAMFLALIRPAKKHLQGLPWNEVAKTIWDKDAQDYSFKKAHAIAYAQMVVVHLNLLKGIQ